MINKKNIKDSLEQLIANKIQSLLEDVKLIDDSAANETKSSAGDKYETSRAMLQQEKDKKLGQALSSSHYQMSYMLLRLWVNSNLKENKFSPSQLKHLYIGS